MEQRARRTAQSMARSLTGSGTMGGGMAGGAAKAADQAAKAQARAASQMERDTQRALGQMNRAWASYSRAAVREQQKVQREVERAAKEQARTIEREAKRAQAAQNRMAASDRGMVESFARRTSWMSLWNMRRGFNFGTRVVGDIARGAGIDTNVGSMVGRSVQNESLATILANQGWNPNETKWEDRIKPGTIRTASQTIANKYGYGEHEVTAAMRAYTNLTGDLKTAIPLMDKLALLSKATGTELDDAANSAADMGVALEKVPNKESVLMQIMGIAAMQGKTGALEMFQLAPQMPRIVSQAGQFAGDPGHNIASLLASTQLIRRYGGVGTPSQAATALVGAVAALQKGGGAAFKKAGVNIRDKRGQLLPLADIVAASLNVSTQGGVFDAKKFFSMWNAQRGGRLAVGLKRVYDEAGGGKAGVAAIRAQYSKFTQPLDVGAQEKMAAEMGATTEAKAKRFQNALDKIVDGVKVNLTPAMEQAGPSILKFAETASRAATWVAEHPKQAIEVGIAASIAKAAIGAAIRAAIDNAITSNAVASALTGVFGKGAPAAMAGKAMGLGGATTAAGGLAGGGVAASIGTAMGYAFVAALAAAGLWWLIDKTSSKRPHSEVGMEAASGPSARGYAPTATGGGGTGSRASNEVSRRGPANMSIGGEGTPLNQSTMTESMRTALSQELRVRITNPEDLKDLGPRVDPNGRTPTGPHPEGGNPSY